MSTPEQPKRHLVPAHAGALLRSRRSRSTGTRRARGEVRRAFEICHGCRMCFKYCDSFPRLFTLIDERHDGDVHRLTAGDVARVMDACFQCKLCEVQCPYTPRDGHEFQLDFPKLVHRYRGVHARGRRARCASAS